MIRGGKWVHSCSGSLQCTKVLEAMDREVLVWLLSGMLGCFLLALLLVGLALRVQVMSTKLAALLMMSLLLLLLVTVSELKVQAMLTRPTLLLKLLLLLLVVLTDVGVVAGTAAVACWHCCWDWCYCWWYHCCLSVGPVGCEYHQRWWIGCHWSRGGLLACTRAARHWGEGECLLWSLLELGWMSVV